MYNYTTIRNLKQVTAFSKKVCNNWKLQDICYNFHSRKSTLRRKGAAMSRRFDFLVLHLLSKEKMYGFQIIKSSLMLPTLKSRWNLNAVSVAANAGKQRLYCPGLVPINERGRKVYHITGKERIYLSKQKEQWIRCMTVANKTIDLWCNLFAFFHRYMVEGSLRGRRIYAGSIHEL